MAEKFQITEGPSDGSAIVLRVSGRLDSATATQLAQRCAEVTGAQRVLLNLAEVTFIASSGVGALLATAEHARESGGSLHLVALSPPVDAVIRLLNLDRFLQIHATEADVLEGRKAA